MRRAGFQPNIATYNSVLCGKLADGDFVQAWQTIDILELNGPGIAAHKINILFKAYKGKRCTMDV